MTEFLVLGAGMAGIGAALALQARGHAVTVLDRGTPGSETSHGNAGVIQSEAVEPYAFPRDPRVLARYALGRTNDLVWHLRDLPAQAPALWRYFRASGAAHHAEIAASYAQLIGRATRDHAPLIDASGSGNLIRKSGLGEVLRTPRAIEEARRQADRMRDRYGVPSEILTGAAIRAADPALTGDVAGLLLWTGSWSASDPGALTRAYAELFERRGGRILKGDAETLSRTRTAWRIDSEEGPVDGEQVVVALGPWSPELLARFGLRVRMIWKRGYHAHYRTPVDLARPYLDGANGVVMTSTTRGLRITTGAELVRRDGPLSDRQMTRGRRALSELLEIGGAVPDSTWTGHRPCLPDMLPLVGRSPKEPSMWFDFGHGHQGFTLGPTTGEILADMVEGRNDALTQALDPGERKDALVMP